MFSCISSICVTDLSCLIAITPIHFLRKTVVYLFSDKKIKVTCYTVENCKHSQLQFVPFSF